MLYYVKYKFNITFYIGNDLNLVKVKSIMCTFIKKVEIYKQQLERNELFHCHRLQDMNNEQEINEHDKLEYILHLNLLIENMNIRFQDLIKLDIPPLLLSPLDYDITDFPLIIQDNIIEIQYNDEYKAEFKAIGYVSFWIKYGIIYPEMLNI